MTRLFVENLTVIDCAFLDAQRGLVGESWIVDLELEGALDEQGMILDFGEVKKLLKRAIDDSADHKLLVPGRSPALALQRAGDCASLRFKAECGEIEHQSPAAALCVLDAEAVAAETLADHLRGALRAALPANVRELGLALRNEPIEGAYYHYTHGLRKHAGHCQRIAHGHRSRLHMAVNGRRDPRLEQRWANRWRDIYLGTTADVVAHGKGRIRFEYRSGEGQFALELPVERCDLLMTDSTVEHIAEHLAAQVAAERPGAKVEVRAYEGVMKGAVAKVG
ncbi:MAG: 6-carboxytetrahydropterin synthase [Gammaproteobacteria bacterium]|nr:6-carboxytetrahydropterin synthase [Gammaproteobacteria bacterium]